MHLTVNMNRLLGAASLCVMAALCATVPTSVAAQTAHESTISVPSMPMAKALNEISRQSGVAIGFDPDAVKGLTSKPVRNARSARDAINIAIRGSKVALVPAANGGLTVVNDIVVIAQRDEAETRVMVSQATTSDRSGLGLREQPRNTQVISAKTIADQQALDISEILRNAGGVSAQANNPNTGASYTVRGFSANGLVNGLAGGSQYGVSTGANQPIATIERVEILKGPDALLSGFGNLGGNVNVVTKKPSANTLLDMSFDTGSYGLARGVIDANTAVTSDKKLSARFITSAQTMDQNYGGYSGSRSYLVAPSLRYKDRLTDIVIGASFATSRDGIGAYTLFDKNSHQIIDRDPSVPIYSPNQTIKVITDRYYFDATRQLTSGIDLVARGMHDENTLTLQVLQLGYSSRTGLLSLGGSGSQQHGQSNSLDTFFRIKGHLSDYLKLRFNLGYNYSDGYTNQSSGSVYIQVANPPLGQNTTVPVTPFSPIGAVQSRSNGSQQGVYGQALLEFWKFKVLGGLRENWFNTSAQYFFAGAVPQPDQNRSGLSPSFGAIFDVTKNFSIFGNYARGMQAVFSLDRNGNYLPNIITTNKEAGIKADFFQKRLTLNASYFDIMQSNIIITNPDRTLSSGPGQRGRGIDLNIAGQLLPGWTLLGSFTRTDYSLLSVTATQRAVPNQPRDTYSISSTYRTHIAKGVTGGAAVSLSGRSSSYADYLGQYVVPPSRQVNINGFLSLAGFDINLGLRNIFNRRNYNTSTVITYVPVDEPRNFRLTMTKHFF